MGTMILPDTLTIASVSEIRDALLEVFGPRPAALAIDGRGVEDVDAAGVQLLLAAAKEAGLQGVALSLDPSAVLQRTLDLLAVTDRFAPPKDDAP